MRQALQEADRLAAEAARLRQDAARHEHEARRMSGAALRLEQRVRELRSVLDSEPRSVEVSRTPEELRGQKVRDTAIEVLLRHRGPMKPIHYRQWHELLEHEGHRVAGQNPLATFLTQIRRSPVVEPVPDRSGFYLVDPERAATKAVTEVRAAEAKLAELVHRGTPATEVELARRTLARAERTLLEVARWQTQRPTARPLALIAGGSGSVDRES